MAVIRTKRPVTIEQTDSIQVGPAAAHGSRPRAYQAFFDTQLNEETGEVVLALRTFNRAANTPLVEITKADAVALADALIDWAQAH